MIRRISSVLILCIVFVALPWSGFAQEQCKTQFTNESIKAYEQFMKDFYKRGGIKNSQLQSNEVFRIKIVRHIVKSSDGTAQMPPTNEDWNYQLNATNKAFANTGIEFYFDPIIKELSNDKYFDAMTNEFNKDDEVATNFIQGAINLYVVRSIDRKPGVLASASVIPYQSNDYKPKYPLLWFSYGDHYKNNNETFKYLLAHEIGHLLGLPHTFATSFGEGRELIDGSNGTTAGDLIADTRADHYGLTNLTKCCDIDNQPKLFDALERIRPCEDPTKTYQGYLDRNVMSYHFGIWERFTDIQTFVMTKVLKDYWPELYKPCFVFPEAKTIEYKNGKYIVQFNVQRIAGASGVVWSFPGGSPSTSNNFSPLVEYDSDGSIEFSVTPLSNVCVQEKQTIWRHNIDKDPRLLAVSLPLKLDFEDGITLEGKGWWTNAKESGDCSFFETTIIGAFGKSRKSLKKQTWNSDTERTLAIPEDLDRFNTPYFKLGGLKTLVLKFDYAFANNNGAPDEMKIQFFNGTEFKTYWSSNGKATAPVANSLFIPKASEWQPVLIDLTNEISGMADQVGAVIFSYTTQQGNSFYIDNIEISGESTTGLELSFDRSTATTTLVWPDFISNKTGYQIQRASLTESNWQTLATVEPNMLTWSEVATTPVIQNRYRILPVTETGILPSNEVQIDTIVKPTRPKMTETIVGGGNVGVKWTDPNNFETNYDLYFSYQRGAPMEKVFSLPANTNEYLHRGVPSNTKLYYMVKAKELGFESDPSDTIEARVNVAPVTSRITRVEAFFDNDDPGFDNAMELYRITNNEDVTALANPALDIGQLSNGLHTLTVRAKDNKGYWSQLYTQPFLKLTQQETATSIEAMQYAIDNTGNSAVWYDVDVSGLSGSNEQLTIQLAPSLISQLTDGIHYITIRAKDNRGHWSNHFLQAFLKLDGDGDNKQLVSLEYSIDNGLLIGSGTAMVLTPGKYVNATIDLPPLSNGKHYISVKAKDEGGYWSNISIDSFVVYDQRFCEKNATVQFAANIPNGKTFYWQQNDGTGWATITNGGIYEGARTSVLSLITPPTEWYGYQYRCVVNGIPLSPYTLKFGDEWTGAIDDDWHNPANWCCYGVPDANTDVYVDPSTTIKPRIKTTAVCRSLLLKSGSHIIIEPGATLEVSGKPKQ